MRLFDRLNRPANKVFRVIGFLSLWRFEAVIGVRKQRNSGNAQFRDLGDGVDQGVDAKPIHVWHRGNRLDRIPAFADENRPHQISGGKGVFRNHRPRPRILTVATHAGTGKPAIHFFIPVFQDFGHDCIFRRVEAWIRRFKSFTRTGKQFTFT